MAQMELSRKEDEVSGRNMLIQRGHCVRVQSRGANSLKIGLKGAGGGREGEECGGIQRLEL